MSDSQRKSIIKTFSWRFIATLTTAVITLAVTGKWEFALTIGAADIVIKLLLYYFHERAWAKVK
jgi:uncharacterized membrane protein